MLTEGAVREKVLEACRWVGIPVEDIDFEVRGDLEACRHGQWCVRNYLFFARWDDANPTVDAVANGSLLRHSDAFCDACVSAALAEFLDKAHQRDEYREEWVPYHRARLMLAAEGLEKHLMVFPKGSFVRICDCGKAEVWSPAEVAFGRADGLSLACPRCGEKAQVGIVSSCVMTSESGIYVEDESGMSRLTSRRFQKHCVLDLGALLGADLVDDVRNVGMAQFLQEGGMGFSESWAYLSAHPEFEGHFPECFDFDAMYVCHDTSRVEDDSTRNTCPQVWVEGGWLSAEELAKGESWGLSQKEMLEGARAYDAYLDTGGWTFEEAVCNLAMAVKYHYGDDVEQE